MDFDPTTARLVESDEFDAAPKPSVKAPAAFDPGTAKQTGEQNKGVAGDLATDAKRGLQQVPGMLTGVVDVAVGALTGQRFADKAADALGEATGFQPGKWADEARAEYSEGRKQAEAEIEQAWDDGSAADIAGAYLRNPGKVAGMVVESIPSMVAGGLAGRAALGVARAARVISTPATAAQAARQGLIAGAGGEGAVIAGQSMDQIDDSVDARRAALASSAAGLMGGALGVAGGRVAQKLGLVDPETLIAGGAAANAGERAASGLVRRMLGGAMAEGVFEELPQSVQETMWQNWAEGKPIFENVPRAAVEGAIAGGVMGAGFNALPNRRASDATEGLPLLGDDEGLPLLGDKEGLPLFTAGDAPVLDERALERAGVTPPPPAPVLNPGQIDRWADLNAVPAAPKPSEQMGIDPSAGPLSAAAAQAVDTGLSPAASPMQQAVAQAGEVDQPGATVTWRNQDFDLPVEVMGPAEADSAGRQFVPVRGELNGRVSTSYVPADELVGWQEQAGGDPAANERTAVDPATGEILEGAPVDRAAALRDRLAFVEQQSRMSGWDQRLIEERERVQAELAAIAPPVHQGAALVADAVAPAAEQAPSERWASMTADERAATVASAGLAESMSRHVPKAEWSKINPKARAKLEQAMQVQPQASQLPAEGTQDAAQTGAQIEQGQTQSLAAPAAGPVLGAAEATQGFDVSGRTDTQLQHLATNGRPGWKEAAQAELGRRSAGAQAQASAEPAPPSAAAAASAPAQATPADSSDVAGAPINGAWTSFAPESGSIGVPRARMPQIRAEHRGAMVKFMNARGVAHRQETVPAVDLKPTQAEFSPRKVKQAKAFAGGDRSILVSADGYVLDGHHQWLAKREAGESVKAIRLEAPIRDLITLAHEFPSSTTAKGAAPKAPAAIEGGNNGAVPGGTDAGVAAASGAQAGADVQRSAGDPPQQPDVPAVGGVQPAAGGAVASRGAVEPAGVASGGRPAVAEPPNWRKNYLQARTYAKALGVQAKDGQKLAGLLADIDAHLAAQNTQPDGGQASNVPATEQVAQEAQEARRQEGAAPRQQGAVRAPRKQADPAAERWFELTLSDREQMVQEVGLQGIFALRTAEKQWDRLPEKVRAKLAEKMRLVASAEVAARGAGVAEAAAAPAPAIATTAPSASQGAQPADGRADEAEGGEQGAGTATSPDDFIPSPSGSIDYGEITPEMAKAMRRQAGKIRLQRGEQNANGTGWGLAHIEANHGSQIRNAGFPSVQNFVAHVAKNFSEVLQAQNRQLLVAVDSGRQDVMFVQLEPEDGGDFYRINTAFPASRNYLEKQQKKGMKLLWGGSEPAPAAAGQQPPYAGAPAEESGQGAPIARGQSSDATVAQQAESAADGEVSLYAQHEALMASVRTGKATPEAFKASFEQVVANETAIKVELSAKTKAELLREGGPYLQMRYANEKKDGVVDAVYRQMIGEYALGETVSYGMARDSYQKAVRRMVDATDADKLAKYAEDRKAAIEEAAAQRMARAEAMENPKTLNDFRSLMNVRIREGKTRHEAFLMLTPAQRIQYDTLEAESSREAREARKRAAKTEVRVAGQTTGGQIIATRHTRDGYDLFVVQLADRMGDEDYRTVLASAKKLGGWYSSFRGNGAVPGFQFKERESAEAFLALAAGNADAARAQAEQRRDAFEDDRSQSAAQRLTEMADRLEDAANEELGRNRKTNTARRARFASAAMNAAEAQKAMAKTMRNIAAAIEAGKATFLDAVRTKSQVEMLTGIVRIAKDNEIRAKHASYAEQEKRKGERPSAETADFAEFPNYTAFRSDLASLARQLLEIDGTKKLGQKLMSVADDVTDAYLEFAKSNLLRVSQFGRGDSLADFSNKADAEKAIRRNNLSGKAIVLQVKRGQNRVILSPSEAMNRGVWTGDGDKRITLSGEFGAELVEAIGRRGSRENQLSVPWQLQSAYDRRKALARIGIETPSEFRSALREFIALQETAIANKVRQMELAMVGRRADGLDFFPTPAEIADQMVEAADIRPDMAVLEPSAGMGHIADRIRAAGAEPDVVEISADRRELLEEKGYHIAEVNDFLNMEPRKFFTFGDIFRAPDGTQGILRGLGGMGSQRVRLEDEQGNRLGLYSRDEVVGVSHRGSWSGYDRIIMNPPFSDRRDAEHVRHAYRLLRPGGRIVAIMGEGVFFGQDKRAQDFRDWLDSVGGTSEKLPEGSFMDPSLPVQTGVNARMVVIDKPVAEVAQEPVNPLPAAGGGMAGQGEREASFSAGAGAQRRRGISSNPITEASLLRALDRQFPGLAAPARVMLERGRRGEKGGLVVIDSADPAEIARIYAEKTGRDLNATAESLSMGRVVHGVFNRPTGTTFLIGPTLDRVTAPAVLLHEMVHGQQRAQIDARAMAMIDGRANEKDPDLRAFLDRVAARMEAAGAAGDAKEAAAYIVELAVIEGRSAGYKVVNGAFFEWADKVLGKKAGALLRSFAMMVRSWVIRHGGAKTLTVDDLVGYAMAGLERASRGDVDGQTGRSVGPISDEVVAGVEELHRVLTGDPVATLQTSEAPHQGKAKLREWAVGIFRDYGFYANNPKLGRVLMDERSVRDSLGHSLNPFKAVAFKAVPDVIERGAIAHIEKRGDMDSIYISAPVVINGADDIVTVLVHRDINSQRMYLHSVTTKESLLRSSQSSADAEASKRSGTVTEGGVSKILRDALNYKADRFSRSAPPGAIEVDGVERPTTNSEGRPIHPTEDGVRNFWRWFGDSDMTDADGAPTVFYHYGNEKIERMNGGGRFAGLFILPHRGAKGYGKVENALYFRGDLAYSKDLRAFLDEQEDGGVSVLSELAGVELDEDGADAVRNAILDETFEEGDVFAETVGAIDIADGTVKFQRMRGELARKAGFGGVTIDDEFNGDSIMVVEPTAIKSATENIGAFDQNDPGVRFSRAGAASSAPRSITPTDKAVYGMAAEGKSAAEILKFVASASRSPFNRQVARLLTKTGIAPSVVVGDGKGWRFQAEAGEGNRYAAAYSPKTDTVALFRPAAAERHMLHELIHAATVAALKKKGAASMQMRALFNHVKKSGKLKGMYGMANVDEFVAEAFTNPDFQRKLREVSAPAGSSLRTAWDWLVRVIKNVLGLPADQESALSRALGDGVALMRENMRLAQSAARGKGAALGSAVDSITLRTGDANAGVQGVVSREEADAFLRDFLNRYAGAPEIVAVSTFDQLPASIQEEAKRQNSDERSTKGVFHRGKVYLVVDNHASMADFEATVFHEVAGHAGVRKLFGEDFAQKLNQVYVGLGGQGGLVRIMSRRGMGDTMQDYIRGVLQAQQYDAEAFRAAVKAGDPRARRIWTDAIAKAVLTEEVFAHIAETVKDRPGLRDKFLELIGRVRQWLRDKGFAHLSNLGESDLLFMLSKARETMRAADGGHITRTGAHGDNQPPVLRSSGGAQSAQQIARSIGDGLKSMTVQDVKRAGRHTLTDWLKVGLQLLGRRQLVDIYGKALPLAEYDRLVAQMEADKNDVGATADDLARRWGKLPDEGKLADLMHDATLAQIDADGDVPYAEGDDRAKSMVLKGRFRALSPEAQKVYREARDSYKRHHAEVRQAIIDRIMRSELRAEKRAELVRRMDADFFKAVKGVYFPLARFGQYVVVVKDGAGKVASVARAETMAEAEAMRDEMRRAFPAADGYQVGRVTLSKEFAASRDMVGRGFMTELYDALDKQNLPAAQLAELEDTLGQLYLSSLPDLSWAKHGIHRKGTPGFSQDARRAFAQNTFHGARYLAKLRYGDLMQTELDRMQKHVDQWSATEGFDQPRAQRVVDEMVKRHDALMSPKSNPISTALTSVGFVYYLGLSPAAAMVNLSQTALVAYPVMAAKWGFKKSGEALLKASAEAVAGKNDIRTQLKDADELAAYDAAVRAGTIDVTMSHDLAGIAQGEDAKVVWKMRPVMRLASGLFHHAERFNRQTTFIASYRLARETGATHLEAYEQATKATYDGHFDYSAGNRPRVMQGNVARVVLLFKQYAQNMIFTIARNAYQSVQGETPEVRREARKVLGALLTLHAAAAGVLGLPLVGPLLTVASALGGDDDEPWDAEVALRNLLADAFGPKASEVIARGFSRLTPWDISGRVGLDKLLLPDVQEGLEGQRWAESFSTAMLGPVIGMGVNAAKAAQKMADGDYGRGLEDLLPIFARNPIKAARYWFEGAQDRTGIEIKGDVSLAGELGQLIGFSPSEVRLAFEGRSAVMDADRRLGERRSALMSQFARAAMEKDVEGMAEAREAIRVFNEKNPGRRITAQQMWQSVRSREKRIREAEDGVYLPRTRRDAMEAGRFAEV